MVDVCGGPLTTMDELRREIEHYLDKRPTKLVVKLKKRKDFRYHFTIWMTKEDFNKTC